MKDSARYVKIVEWSEEDHCYVGSAPGLMYDGAHGDDERRFSRNFAKLLKRQSISTARKASRYHRRHPAVTSPTKCNRSRELLEPTLFKLTVSAPRGIALPETEAREDPLLLPPLPSAPGKKWLLIPVL